MRRAQSSPRCRREGTDQTEYDGVNWNGRKWRTADIRSSVSRGHYGYVSRVVFRSVCVSHHSLNDTPLVRPSVRRVFVSFDAISQRINRPVTSQVTRTVIEFMVTLNKRTLSAPCVAAAAGLYIVRTFLRHSLAPGTQPYTHRDITNLQ